MEIYTEADLKNVQTMDENEIFGSALRKRFASHEDGTNPFDEVEGETFVRNTIQYCENILRLTENDPGVPEVSRVMLRCKIIAMQVSSWSVEFEG